MKFDRMSMRFLAPDRLHQLSVIRDSGLFDSAWYSERYPDVVDLGIEPDAHYVWIGAALGRDPNPDFNTRFYLGYNPDVLQSGLNPFFHYVASGREEGRQALPPSGPLPDAIKTERRAQFRVDRSARIGPDEDWLLFVAYSPDGRLSDCQKFQLSSFHEAGYRVALIVNSDDFSNLAAPGTEHCDIQIVRENIGFDFGAWRHALELLGGLDKARSLTFTNDSILPAKSRTSLAQLRNRVAEASAPVVFLTENREVRPHSQSFFFCLKREALADALSVIASVPFYLDKDALIHEVEIHLSDQLRETGHAVHNLFSIPGTDDNLTIHHWEELLDLGMPFLKIQLVTAGIVPAEDPRLAARLNKDVHRWLCEHCDGRGGGSSRLSYTRNVPSVPAMKNIGRFNPYGAQQAFNLPPEQNATVHVPLDGIALRPPAISRILAIIHGYYVDVAKDILGDLAELDIPMRVLVTTDHAEKVEAIEDQIRQFGLTGEVVLCPNRGRDVAPFLIEGARLAGDAEVILHLHTKKSPHDEAYAGWGGFLRQNLVGSSEIVMSILKILDETSVGFVYSDHFSEVVDLRNWGFDFDHARSLLGKLGIKLGADDPLEFPTSTMFWARREALDPLFKAGLSYDDFEPEAGQIDGTLAHAIERSFLYVAQSVGCSFAKVTASDLTSEASAPLLRLSEGEIAYALDRPQPFLSGGSTVRSDFCRAVPEIYPVSVGRSRSGRRRLNALLPTMKPEKIYGGITTALRTIGQLIDALPDDVDVRVLITSDSVDAASVDELSRRLHRSFTWAMPDDDIEGDTIVGMAEAQHLSVSLRAGEIYIATAWWTANLGYRLLDRQREIHGSSARLAYIIQDYEPGFYNWSNTYALAEATYHREQETVAILNSEELTNYVLARHDFALAYCLPYEPHPRLVELIEPQKPERLILAYGRPGVSRNCFEVLLEGLRLWQARNPAESKDFEIVFAGEEFEEDRIAGLFNARNAAKMSIDDYASMLNRAAVGVSLMVSPHPSYPPLEMASAGCVTITNAYEGKDLSRRADNIISMDALNPEVLAESLERALALVLFDEKKKPASIKPMKSPVPPADFDSVAEWMLDTSAKSDKVVPMRPAKTGGTRVVDGKRL